MGRIAAGVPIEAIQHKTHSISVPPDMISGGEHYALEVKGNSMIEAGIFDGDTVIIRNASTANPGEIIVALVDDEEATLKRFRRKGASIALEAANPAYETRIFGPGPGQGAGQAGRADPPLLIAGSAGSEQSLPKRRWWPAQRRCRVSPEFSADRAACRAPRARTHDGRARGDRARSIAKVTLAAGVAGAICRS